MNVAEWMHMVVQQNYDGCLDAICMCFYPGQIVIGQIPASFIEIRQSQCVLIVYDAWWRAY